MSVYVDVHLVEYDPITGKQKSLGSSVGTLYADYLEDGLPGMKVSANIMLKKTGRTTHAILLHKDKLLMPRIPLDYPENIRKNNSVALTLRLKMS